MHVCMPILWFELPVSTFAVTFHSWGLNLGIHPDLEQAHSMPEITVFTCGYGAVHAYTATLTCAVVMVHAYTATLTCAVVMVHAYTATLT